MVSIFPVPIPHVSHVYLYPKPISMRLGESKLIDLCKNEMGLTPKEGLVFLFFNQAQDKIKLFYLDEMGSQEVMKVLLRGGFLVPVATENEKYIRIKTNKLSGLFRM